MTGFVCWVFGWLLCSVVLCCVSMCRVLGCLFFFVFIIVVVCVVCCFCCFNCGCLYGVFRCCVFAVACRSLLLFVCVFACLCYFCCVCVCAVFVRWISGFVFWVLGAGRLVLIVVLFWVGETVV